MKLRTKVKRLKEENERLKAGVTAIYMHGTMDHSIFTPDYERCVKASIEKNLTDYIKKYIEWDERRFKHNPNVSDITAKITIVIPEGKR